MIAAFPLLILFHSDVTRTPLRRALMTRPTPPPPPLPASCCDDAGCILPQCAHALYQFVLVIMFRVQKSLQVLFLISFLMLLSCTMNESLINSKTTPSADMLCTLPSAEAITSHRMWCTYTRDDPKWTLRPFKIF